MSEELKLFGENVRRFVETEVAPNYESWEKAEILPRELWNTLGSKVCCAWIYQRNTVASEPIFCFRW